MDTRTFTIHDATALADIIRAAQGNKHVRRLIDDRIVEGTARSVGDANFNFALDGEDVRDLFLRVTTVDGWDVGWPLTQLIDDLAKGFLAFD